MKLYLFALAAVVYFTAPIALAQEVDRTADSVVESDNQPEDVQIKRTLATYLGLTSQEVVFGKPRNFRAESLNNLTLDPLTDEAE